MGGGYSDLNIYIKHVGDKYSGSGYDVEITRNKFKGCCDFLVITHNIKFKDESNPQYYNVQLYNGYTSQYNGDYVFGYYYPNSNDVLVNVSIYYSVLAPEDPLVICFTTKGSQKYYCLPSVLRNARWDRAYNITEHTFSSSLAKPQLTQEFQKLSLNRKIGFKIGNESKDIKGNEQIIDKDYFRYIYRPSGNESILGSDYLFSLDTLGDKPNIKNKINEYYLKPLEDKYYDGIMVYYKKETLTKYNEGTKDAVLLEFVDSKKDKVQLKKLDKDGYWWSQESVSYDNDAKLLTVLQSITEQAKDECATVILDNRKNYEGLDKCESDDKKSTYNKYTYIFGKAKKTILIYDRKLLNSSIFANPEIKTKCADVYFLKSKNSEDIEPFLIVLDPNDNGKKDNCKAYHFTDSYNFEKWKTFEFKQKPAEKPLEGQPLIDKINERLGRIEDNLSCLDNLNLLRMFALKILDGEDPTQEEVKKEQENVRPEVRQPKPKPDPLPIYWIIGGSVGGGVFVISSASLYGVYWYNTTIKLLT